MAVREPQAEFAQLFRLLLRQHQIVPDVGRFDLSGERTEVMPRLLTGGGEERLGSDDGVTLRGQHRGVAGGQHGIRDASGGEPEPRREIIDVIRGQCIGEDVRGPLPLQPALREFRHAEVDDDDT